VFENVEWNDVVKYLRVDMTEDEIDHDGFRPYVPKFSKRGNKKMTFLDTDKEEKWDWSGTRDPDMETKRDLIAKMMEIFVSTIMENHVYQFEGHLYLQSDGRPIGLLVTGTLARLVMLWWDHLFLKKLSSMKIEPEMYLRYVDDEGIATKPIPRGTVYKDGKLTREIIDDNEDDEEGDNKRTARVHREISDDIMTMIKFEEDTEDHHENGRIPILDLECWVEDAQIHHVHYHKPMASRQVIANSSAIATRTKRTILEQEALRRSRNFGTDKPWEDKAAALEEFNLDMVMAGYPESFRKTVLIKTVFRYKADKKNHDMWLSSGRQEGRPKYRSGSEEEGEEGGQGEQHGGQLVPWDRWLHHHGQGQLLSQQRAGHQGQGEDGEDRRTGRDQAQDC
jgi:hypothetical protein